MTWKVSTMSEKRRLLVGRIAQGGVPVAQVCREFGVSRTTAYKWVRRWNHSPLEPLEDRSRRPLSTPARTGPDMEAAVLAVHGPWRWGARKIHAILKRQGVCPPSVNTIQAILQRHNAVGPARAPADPAPGRFEWPCPNDLWQMDFKGPLEVGRTPVHPLTVMDDHSRFLLCLEVMPDHRHAPLWDVLWRVFGQAGLPDALLCDNEFSTRHQAPRTLSWFDSQLLRVGVRPVHGRFQHPQTQGKAERIHRTYEQELIRHARRDCLDHFIADARRWRDDYNHLRPHEALEMQTPAQRWRLSRRPRPQRLPEPYYPAGSTPRKVGMVGDIRWDRCRINVGRGLVGQHVGVVEQSDGLAVYYCDHRVRLLKPEEMELGRLL